MSLTEKLHEQHARIAVLKASEAELTQGPDAALSVLGPPTDPIRMRAALGILLRADRHQAAADLLRDQRLDEKWLDMAALVYASLGEIPRAQSVVEQADNSSDPASRRLARLAFAEGVIEYWCNQNPNTSLLEPRDWPQTDVDLARTTIDVLDPLLSLVRANQQIDGEYELGAVTYAAYCGHIAKDPHLLSRCVSWLVRHVPLPLIVAEFCLRGMVNQAPDGLPNRMRLEHLGNFQAGFLAALMDRELLGRADDALGSLIELSEFARTDAEKLSVCVAVFETCGGCDPLRIDQAAEVVKKLRPDDHRLLGLVKAVKHLVQDDVAAARANLDAIRNDKDGVWWQAYAQLCEKSGEHDLAQDAWEKASQLLPHPDVVRRSVKASLDRKKYASAVHGLLKLLENDPKNAQHLNAVAWAFLQMGDLAEAAKYLKRLVETIPSNAEYRIRLAQCLVRLGKIPDAIRILEPVIRSEEAPLEAVFLQSELLGANNQSGEAFHLLDSISADHWDDPRFLLLYMRHGHASGNDQLAHEAFGRLLELRKEGRVPSELMQEGTLEQLLEYGKEYHKRREALQERVVQGQLPWLFVEAILRHPAVWAWELHTQELNWLGEEPLTRAALSIYATNAFTVQPGPAGRTLEAIIATPKHTEAVADLSALLTLHQLDRLEGAADYCGQLILPASYGELRIREADRFGLHQPSREAELKRIREEIDRGRIRVVESVPDAFRLLDEYSDEEVHAYRLQDLIQPLLEAQKVTSAVVDELRGVAHWLPAADEAHPALNLGDSVIIDLMTLRTLSKQPIFEPMLDSFNVHIRASQKEAIVGELRAHERAHAVRSTHDSLWQAIASLEASGKLKWLPVPARDAIGDDQDDDSPPSVYLDAARLAVHLKKPLLADDRVLQVLNSQRAPANSSHVVDSACLVQGLLASGACTLQEAAADIHRLMQWRYRFIIPPVELLLEWATQGIDNPPGSRLLDVAVYLHDCLRDPGLFCGLEQTDPPMPMAVKLVNAWMQAIVGFLARVWNNAEFSEDKCVSLTRWVGEELVPSCPRGLWYQPIGQNIAKVERTPLFGMAVVQFAAVDNPDRANLGLRTLAEALGLREEQYMKAVVDGIEVSSIKAELLGEHAEAHKSFSRLMLQKGLLHLKEIGLDPVHAVRLRAAGLLMDVSPPEVPAALLEILQTPDNPIRTRAPAGPLIFLPEAKTVSVIEVAALLLNPDILVRSAALTYLESGILPPQAWLTSDTQELFAKRRDDIRAEPEEKWRDGAIDVVTAVRRDFFAILAALRQSIACRYQEGIDQYLHSIIHPAFETLVNLRPPLYAPSEQRDEITAWTAETSRHPEIETALTQYLDHWGYVPLAAGLGAPNVVKSWLDQHPNSKLGWDQLWAWANNVATPLAKYHALTVAFHIPAMRPKSSLEPFWEQVADVLDLKEGASNIWHVYCELASHLARHIEALHPGQHGERIACYAWWLAQKVGQIVGTDESRAKHFQETILTPAQQFSYFRWTLSRSPVLPSSFRHATLHARSVWAMSLLVQLSLATKPFLPKELPERMRSRLGKVLNGYLLTSNLTDSCETSVPIFAFEENSNLEELCAVPGFVSEDMRNALGELIQFRRGLASPEQLRSRLDRFQELPFHEQHVTLLVLNDVLFATSKYDDLIASWLNEAKQVVNILSNGHASLLGSLLDLLSEFQQRALAAWMSRLPHLLAYAIEQIDDTSIVARVSTAIIQMCNNGGVASPILRVISSNKWSEWRKSLAIWHENLAEVAKYSEPWVAARVRAVSAVISRLIGPRAST